MPFSLANNIRPLRRVEYEKLVQLGMFERERLELLDGSLVLLEQTGPEHDFVVRRLGQVLGAALSGRARIAVQRALPAGSTSAPCADLAVLAPSTGVDSSPPAELVVEVADSAIERERTVKLRIYARAQVPEYWIVDLQDRCIEVYTHPVGSAYDTVEHYEASQVLHPARFADVALRVDALLR